MKTKLGNYILCVVAAMAVGAFPAIADMPETGNGSKVGFMSGENNTGMSDGDNSIMDLLASNSNIDIIKPEDEWHPRDVFVGACGGCVVGVVLSGVFMCGICHIRKKEEPDSAQTSNKTAHTAMNDLDQTREESAENKTALARNVDRTSHLSHDTFGLSSSSAFDTWDALKRSNVGIVHHIGRRGSQQDNYGVSKTPLGLLAVVSDGMGGLSDGDKVSRQVVDGMKQAAGRLGQTTHENPLFEMLAETNGRLLNMLGPGQIYRSGATLLTVLANQTQFHWIAVGDSRIYLYCGHHLIQMNSEHIYKRQLIIDAVNGRENFASIRSDPHKDSLTSFLGMGALKYVEGSLRPVDIMPGDKILLMSDGVFNTITERQIIQILESSADAAEAAAWMQRQVLEAGNPGQDNFTCVILDICDNNRAKRL